MRQKTGLRQVPNLSQGIEFEVSGKFLLRQLAGFLMRQKNRACSPKIPMKN
jgi:hypothetical protein